MGLRLFGARGGREASKGLLGRALDSAYGIKNLPEIDRTAKGKPFFPQRPGLHFNLSHSGGLILCALAEVPVGADIEFIKPRCGRLAERIMSAPEYARWERDGSLERLYELWTLKESFLKYIGEGLRVAPETVEFEIGDEILSNKPACNFRLYGGEGFKAALCAPRGTEFPEDIEWV